MRIIGYILVISGFLSLAASAGLAIQAAHARHAYFVDHLPKTEMVERQQAAAELLGLAMSLGKGQQGIFIPAGLMLIGAIFLDQARRHQREKTCQPTVGRDSGTRAEDGAASGSRQP